MKPPLVWATTSEDTLKTHESLFRTRRLTRHINPTTEETANESGLQVNNYLSTVILSLLFLLPLLEQMAERDNPAFMTDDRGVENTSSRLFHIAGSAIRPFCFDPRKGG